jgi:MFS family permease
VSDEVSDDVSEGVGAKAPSDSRLRRFRRTVLADITPLRQSADFRRLFFSGLISIIGTQMTMIVLFLQIYDITQSNFAVGLSSAFAFIPMVVGGLYGGSVADARDRRTVAFWSTAALTGVSLLFTGLAFAEVRIIWPLYLLFVVQSWFAAIAQPTRMAIIPRLISSDQLPAANALAQIAQNVGFTLGPVIGATLAVGVGFGWAYLVDALSFVYALYAYWRLPSIPPEDAEHRAGVKSIVEGLSYLKSRKNLAMTFYVDIVAMVFGMQRALFAAIPLAFYGAITTQIAWFDVGIAGLLAGAGALGAVLGAIGSGWIPRIHRQGLAVVLSIVAWGLAITAFGLTRNLWLGLLFLAIAGAADMVSAVFRLTILQASTPDALRGRLQGVLIAVVVGGPLLGDLRAGAVADLVSLQFAIVSGGLLCIAGVGLLCLRFPGFLRYDARNPIP